MLIVNCGGFIFFLSIRELQDQLVQRENLGAEAKRFVMKTKHRNIKLRFQESPTPLISTGNGFSETIYSLLNVKFVLTFIWRVTR